MGPVRHTLLLIDVVESTAWVEQLGDARAAEVWARHDRAARGLLLRHGGREIDKTDGFLLLFDEVSRAVGFALDWHGELRALSADLGVELAARVGLHQGPVVLRENPPEHVAQGAKPLEVEGLAKPLAARVMSLAGAGQTLLTRQAADELGTLPPSIELRSHGHWRLKGVTEPVEILEVGGPRAPMQPPADSAKVHRVVWRDEAWMSLRDVPGDLPPERDAFVGRSGELRALHRALEGGGGLVTLVGPAGVGKSRIAQRYGRVWSGDWPGGVWHSALRTSADLPRHHHEPAEQPTLWILDDADLLDASRLQELPPGTTLLVTRRLPLGLAGEQVQQIGALHAEEARALLEIRAPSLRWSDPGALIALLQGSPRDLELAARSRMAPAGRPFRGLESFTTEDRHLFFGREQEARELAARFRDHSLVTVTGPSGSGKSSLLAAGLADHLTHHVVITVRPGAHPVENLVDALWLGSPHRVAAALEATGQADVSLRGAGHTLPAQAPALLVVIDQAEELLTLTRDLDSRLRAGHVAVALAGLPRTLVALVVREDFFARMATVGSLKGRYNRAVVVLTPPEPVQLEHTLRMPAALYGHLFEAGLVERMVEEVAGDPAALPLLQFCADRLWQQRDRGRATLTVAAYEAMGGVGGALTSHADAVIARLSPRGQEEARRQLLRLVTSEHTRAPRRRAVLVGSSADADLAADVLDALVGARLLSAREDAEGEPVVELVHEALVGHWQQLQDWLLEDQEGQRLLRAIAKASASWERAGRSEDRLWRGQDVAQLRLGLDRARLDLTHLEAAFVESSVRSERRRRWRRRAVVAGVFCVVTLGLVIATGLWREAEQARRETEQALRQAEAGQLVAQSARAGAEGRQAESLHLAADALRHAPDPTQARQQLYGLLGQLDAHRVFRTEGRRYRENGPPWPATGGRLMLLDGGQVHMVDTEGRSLGRPGLDPRVAATARWSPDGRAFVTSEGGLRLFDASGAHQEGPLPLGTRGTWSAGGSLLTISTWDSEAATETITFRALDGQVVGQLPTSRASPDILELSPAGDRYAVAEPGSGQLAIHRVDGSPVSRLDLPKGCIPLEAAWREDGERLAVASWCGSGTLPTHQVVEPDTGRVLHTAQVVDRAGRTGWHPDGETLVVAQRGEDSLHFHRGEETRLLGGRCEGRPRLTWDEDQQRLLMVCMEGYWVHDREGRLLASGSLEAGFQTGGWLGAELIGTVSKSQDVALWRIPGEEPRVAMPRGAEACAWSADGEQLAVRGSLGELAILDATGDQRAGHGSRGHGGSWAWHPRDARVASLGRDRLRVLDARTGAAEVDLPLPAGPALGVAWHPDGELLAVFHSARTGLFDPTTGAWTPLDQASVTQGVSPVVGWSPRGDRLLALSRTEPLRIWDADGTLLTSAPLDRYRDVRWSPQGDRLLVSSAPDDPEPSTRLLSSEGELLDRWPFVVLGGWSPDGEKLVALDNTGQRVVDSTTQRTLAELPFELAAARVQWSPDSRHLALVHSDQSVTVWSATGELLAEIPASSKHFHTVCWHPDGDRFSRANDRSVRTFPLGDEALLAEVERVAPRGFLDRSDPHGL